LPDAALFRALHRPGTSIPVRLELADPGYDPAACAAALAPDTIFYLLETAGGPADLERRTYLAWDPEYELVLRRGWLETRVKGEVRCRVRALAPLERLRVALAGEGGRPVSWADGFAGGLIGYVAYDFKNYLERLPDTVRDDLGLPDLRLGFVRRVVAWDRRTGRLSLRTSVRCSEDPRRDWARAHADLERLHAELLETPAPARSAGRGAAATMPAAGPLRSNLSRTGYHHMLARARQHILAGDIYQANLSHRFAADFHGRAADLYRRLRAINPSPFACWMRFPEHEVVSCSPERLVRLEHGRVETRPIAGTRPRGADRAADRRLTRDLLADEKERAEHLMIVDMARNDIGRVCEHGSVTVERFMRPEAYSHVRHLVSNVVGSLRSDRDAFHLLGAVFPGASITGVPKVRCMQIIDALEEVRRGVYTGSAGWIGLDGGMDMNILIRTFLLQGGRAYFQVGGGIVADSDAQREYEETLAKGSALEEALRSVPAAPRAAAAGARQSRASRRNASAWATSS
jgi:anthranilate/para-aminobenzoate synthase component I